MLFGVRTTIGQEKVVADLLVHKQKQEKHGIFSIAVIDNLIEQNREIGNRVLAARNEQQLKQRKAEIQNLETQNSADELRALLENATGEDRQNIELAIQEKFKSLPQAVRDSNIHIYTGKEAAAGTWIQCNTCL